MSKALKMYMPFAARILHLGCPLKCITKNSKQVFSLSRMYTAYTYKMETFLFICGCESRDCRVIWQCLEISLLVTTWADASDIRCSAVLLLGLQYTAFNSENYSAQIGYGTKDKKLCSTMPWNILKICAFLFVLLP